MYIPKILRDKQHSDEIKNSSSNQDNTKSSNKEKISYKNNGTTALSNFVVSDFWPATLNYVSASPLPSNPPYGNSCAGGCTLLFYPQGALAQGSIGEIILTGTIK